MTARIVRLTATAALLALTLVGVLTMASSPASARPISEAQNQCSSYTNGTTNWVSYSGGYACWWWGSSGGWTVDFYGQDGSWTGTCTGDGPFAPKYCFN